ncbi:MAG: hypothetical protein AB1552_04540 [Nitrospirota bacterium]
MQHPLVEMSGQRSLSQSGAGNHYLPRGNTSFQVTRLQLLLKIASLSSIHAPVISIDRENSV